MFELTILFIVGNGFDLAHGMSTGFNNFRDYLRNEYSYDHDVLPQLWVQNRTILGGDYGYDADECAHAIDYLITNAPVDKNVIPDNSWNEFEKKSVE